MLNIEFQSLVGPCGNGCAQHLKEVPELSSRWFALVCCPLAGAAHRGLLSAAASSFHVSRNPCLERP